ncbi:MAG: mycothiol transferase [Ancrocorticia sp.]|uniref:mycothiol transferase n=1 Tax=Ancrocorticia sp. TaxID=2593684 RepID=UPI003F8DC88C
MDAQDVLLDAAGRPAGAARALHPALTAGVLNFHLGEHDNSVAWLLWHTGREIDAQLAELTGGAEVWERFRERAGLGELGDSVGYGHTPEQARAIVADDASVLLEYIEAATDSLRAYIAGLSEEDLDEVIDENWDPPTTRGARLVSIIDDAAQHVGQAAYVVGAVS